MDLHVHVHMHISEDGEYLFFLNFHFETLFEYSCFYLFFFFIQALSMLLNATPFAFVIDLACLASRREYLKLDKWLSDKIREHGVS